MKYTEQQVLKAIYESGLHQYAPTVIRESYKDGISITIPSSVVMNFVDKLTERNDK
jgi:hypothetical protein